MRLTTLALCGWAASVGAGLAPVVGPAAEDAPTIERVVVPGGAGGNRLEVDVELLAGAASGLGDLRLVAADGSEVPYLLIGPSRPEPRWIEGRVLPLRRTRFTSGFEVDLGELATVDGIRVDGLGAPFLKRLRLEAGGDRARWTVLDEQATLFDLPTEGLSLLELGFEPGEYRYLRVTWDDRSSARLPLPARVRARRLEGAPPPSPLEAPMPFERRASEPGRTRVLVRLPAAGLPIVAFELAVDAPQVLRPARVTEARLAGSELRPHVLGEAVLRRVVRDELVASRMEVPVRRPREAEVEIEIDDGDNPPLEPMTVSARFEAQPWIYFESPDGAALTARYGAPGLQPPSYDLEVLRSTPGPGALAEAARDARWGPSQPLEAPSRDLPASIGDAVGAGAAIELEGFRTRRAVEPGPVGLNALRLDSAVLARSRRLEDLRIVDVAAVQVPYILESLGEPTVVDLGPLERLPDDAGARQSAYRLTLPYGTLPAARLTLTTPARVFERRVRLVREKARGRRDPPVRVSLDEAVWGNADPEREAPPLRLEVPERAGPELLLVVDEGDNSALEIERPRLYLPSYRLRFIRRDDEPLWLVYGKAGLAAPRYDLALLAPRVLGARVAEVGLSDAEEELPGTPWARRGTALFWGALVVVLLVLLGLLARLLRRAPEEG
jgi:hypothetical protein